MMASVRAPRSIPAAIALCERFALLDGQIETIEADRQASIAAVNGRCDTAANDLIAERDAIAAKVLPWFERDKDTLLTGARKSVELGGCLLGSRTGKAVLAVAGKEADIADALHKLRWAKALVRVKSSLDRNAVGKALDGQRAAELQAIGLSMKPGSETFYIERAEQSGTRT